jgi:tryptophanyl-tRNA synthetase
MAVGLDPKKVTLYKQSDVPQVTELAWIFNCLTTVPYLERAHAYKDKVANGKEANVGLFDYPLLMAADILIQDADLVPTGQDQKQHVEIARDTAEKFTNAFGACFKLPEPYIPADVATVPGTDGKKMSKSYGNTIPLFSSRSEIEELVMGIVTDSGSDRPENVYAIHKLVKSERELDALYEEHKGKYKALKEALVEDLDAFIAPMRARYHELASDPRTVADVLEKGGQLARERANAKIETVRRAIGVA